MRTPAPMTPETALLSPQQAAAVSGMPRHLLLRAMDAGHLPFQRQGEVRRIALADLMAYQEERANRRDALRELTQLSEEAGLYHR